MMHNHISPGRLLKEARESRGLSLDDVSQALHFSLRLINNLEQDIYPPHENAFFLKGYLRTYAKYLEIKEQAILEAYEYFQLSMQPEEIVAIKQTEKRYNPVFFENKHFRLLATIAIILLILLFLWWYGHRTAPVPAEFQPHAELKPAVSSSASTVPMLPLTPATPVGSNSSLVITHPHPANVSAPVLKTIPPATSVALPPAPVTLTPSVSHSTVVAATKTSSPAASTVVSTAQTSSPAASASSRAEHQVERDSLGLQMDLG